jgi:hypothetical protein
MIYFDQINKKNQWHANDDTVIIAATKMPEDSDILDKDIV